MFSRKDPSPVLLIFSVANSDFRVLSADIHSIHKASTIALLVVSAVLIPVFIGWMQYQEKHQRNALIPNSLWKNWVFTSCCLMVLFTTAVCNCMELYSSLL